MGKAARRTSSAWRGLVIVFLGLAISLAGFIYYSQTSAGSRWLLEFLREQLALRTGTTMLFRTGELRLLSGFEFKDLEISRETPEGALVFRAPELRLRYGVHWLRRHLEIEEFSAVNASLVMVSRKAAVLEEEKPSPAPSRDWTDFFRAPPITVDARRIELANFAVDMKTSDAETESAIQVKGLNLRLAFSHSHEQLAIKGVLPRGATFALRAASLGGSGFRVQLDGEASGSWDLGIRFDSGEWIYEVAPTSFAFNLSNVQMESRDEFGGTTAARLASLRSEANFELLARTRELFQGSTDAVKRDRIQAVIEVGRLEMAKGSPGAKSVRLEVPSQSVRLASNLDSETGSGVEVEASYQLRKLNFPSALRRPVSAELATKATLARDLESLRFSTNIELEKRSFLKLAGEARVERALKKTLHADASLSIPASPVLALLKPAQAESLKGFLPLTAESELSLEARDDGARGAELKLRIPRVAVPGTTGAWLARMALKLHAPPPTGAKESLSLEARIEGENEKMGNWRISSRDELSGLNTSALAMTGETEIEQTRRGDRARMPLSLSQPVRMEHRLELKGKSAEFDLQLAAPSIGIEGKAEAGVAKLALEARSSDWSRRESGELSLKVLGGPIRLDSSFGTMPIPLKDFALELRASLRDFTRVALERFDLAIDQRLLELKADGSLDAKSKDARMKTRLNLDLPSRGFELAGQTVKGRIAIPVSLKVDRGRELSLQGEADLSGVSWRKDKIGLSGINGRVPFSEKFVWDGKDLRFSRLINQNPFERVVFDRVRPLLSGAEQLRIDRIHWEERAHGPFIGFFSIEQNMLSVHQFDLDLGSGRVHGELFLDAYPANLRLGVLARMTALDLAQVLPARFLARLSPGEKAISARSGFVVSLNRGVVDGRVDVTDMGRDQLDALINVLDPSYEDSKMNRLRGLLRLGYPTSVSMIFRDGYMDMDIDLMIARIGARESVREIPLSSLLAGPTSEIVKATKKGPLKQ